MKDYELTPLEREVFAEMARLNNTEPEVIYKTSIQVLLALRVSDEKLGVIFDRSASVCYLAFFPCCF